MVLFIGATKDGEVYAKGLIRQPLYKL